LRILVVAPQPFFTPRGTPFSVYHRIRITCELGHAVDLLTFGEGLDVAIERCRIIRIPAFRFLGSVPIGPSAHKLFLDCFMIFRTIGLLLRHRYDAVHAHEEAVFWCRWLKPVFRFPLIYDMHSSLPQQLHNFRYTELRVIHWLFEKFEKSGLKASNAVIVICPSLRDYAASLTDPGKVVMIENSLFDEVRFAGPDGDEEQAPGSEPMPISAATEEWLAARHPDRVVVYAGTLEPYQGIDRLLEAFTRIVTELPAAGLLIVGGAPRDVQHYRSLADRFELGYSVHFAGQVSQPDAHLLVSRATASVSPRMSGTNTPMKIYHLMASGMPIVATRIESHTQVLNDEISILTDPEPAALAEAIVRVLRDPEAAREAGCRAQAWYHENYSEDKYTAKTSRVLALVS
jgi:glycosyltransferase involved in cell wall biosynthesis